jgi:hypothetical protein
LKKLDIRVGDIRHIAVEKIDIEEGISGILLIYGTATLCTLLSLQLKLHGSNSIIIAIDYFKEYQQR